MWGMEEESHLLERRGAGRVGLSQIVKGLSDGEEPLKAGLQ